MSVQYLFPQKPGDPPALLVDGRTLLVPSLRYLRNLQGFDDTVVQHAVQTLFHLVEPPPQQRWPLVREGLHPIAADFLELRDNAAGDRLLDEALHRAQQQAAAAIPGPTTWDQLSEEQQALLRVLLQHKGAAAAVQVPVAAERAGLPPRRAQRVAKALIEEHGIPIGTSRRAEQAGWFLCATEAELEAAYAVFQRQAFSILRRARAFHPKRFPHLAELFKGQVALPQEAPDAP